VPPQLEAGKPGPTRATKTFYKKKLEHCDGIEYFGPRFFSNQKRNQIKTESREPRLMLSMKAVWLFINGQIHAGGEMVAAVLFGTAGTALPGMCFRRGAAPV
jgi:hypothetical protein